MTAAAPAAVVTRHVAWLRGPFPPRMVLALRGPCGYVTDWHLADEHESHAVGELREHAAGCANCSTLT